MFDVTMRLHIVRIQTMSELLKAKCGLSRDEVLTALEQGQADTKEVAAAALRELVKKYRNQKRVLPVGVRDAALTLLEKSDQPPGPDLMALLGEVLELDKHRIRWEAKANERQDHAVWAEAHNPDIGVRELARTVGVDPSTVRDWHKDPSYLERVENMRCMLEKRGSDCD